MTRSAKIKALAEEYYKKYHPEDEYEGWESEDFKAGILAGIALRDSELLAMEFDEQKVDDYMWQKVRDQDMAGFKDGAKWQHQQIIEKVKGEV